MEKRDRTPARRGPGPDGPDGPDEEAGHNRQHTKVVRAVRPKTEGAAFLGLR